LQRKATSRGQWRDPTLNLELGAWQEFSDKWVQVPEAQASWSAVQYHGATTIPSTVTANSLAFCGLEWKTKSGKMLLQA